MLLTYRDRRVWIRSVTGLNHGSVTYQTLSESIQGLLNGPCSSPELLGAAQAWPGGQQVGAGQEVRAGLSHTHQAWWQARKRLSSDDVVKTHRKCGMLLQRKVGGEPVCTAARAA